MREIIFKNNCYYHIVNRGIDDKEIFRLKKDYKRFLISLYVFNNKNSSYLTLRDFFQTKKISIPIQPYIEIYALCLMPNHYHILLKQKIDNGISDFFQKLDLSFTKYFNRKYERKGRLFQSSFKAIEITTEEQLLHTKRYIELNPLDLYSKKWREGKIRNWKSALKFLIEYPYNSFQVHIGTNKIKLLDNIINKEGFREYFRNLDEYIKFLKDWSMRNEYVDLNLE